MADEQYETLTVVGRQVKDVSVERDGSGQPVNVDLPGTYEVGVQVHNTFLPLAVFKAGNFLGADGTPTNPPPDKPSESATTDGDGNPN